MVSGAQAKKQPAAGTKAKHQPRPWYPQGSPQGSDRPITPPREPKPMTALLTISISSGAASSSSSAGPALQSSWSPSGPASSSSHSGPALQTSSSSFGPDVAAAVLPLAAGETGHHQAFDDEDMAEAMAENEAETKAANEHGIPWAMRGPANAGPATTDYWKGQRYRITKDRWSRRGGSCRDFWDAYYGALRQGASKQQAQEHANKWQEKVRTPGK